MLVPLASFPANDLKTSSKSLSLFLVSLLPASPKTGLITHVFRNQSEISEIALEKINDTFRAADFLRALQPNCQRTKRQTNADTFSEFQPQGAFIQRAGPTSSAAQ
jgi:hypothetical protein